MGDFLPAPQAPPSPRTPRTTMTLCPCQELNQSHPPATLHTTHLGGQHMGVMLRVGLLSEVMEIR